MDESERSGSPETDPAPNRDGAAETGGQQQLFLGESQQQDADLADSLLQRSTLSAGRFGLVELLTQVASMAVQAIPGADGAGLTLLKPDRADIIVKSTDLVREIDDIQ